MVFTLYPYNNTSCFLGREQVNLQGPYCFWNDDFFVPNYRICHCLNIPQNSQNLEYRSHLVKNAVIYYRCEFAPLGSGMIKESAFWLITGI